jgi:BMFP domain-containing protein YqiC
MSTLTQNSLDEALQKMREETSRAISELREEMKSDVRNMEQSIAASVVAALQSKNPINMEVEPTTEGGSTGAASNETTATMKSVLDRFDSLTQIVISLADKVKTLSDNQDKMMNKRSRSKETEATRNDDTNQESRSPPAKQQRPPSTPPSTPPPYGNPSRQGSREGN